MTKKNFFLNKDNTLIPKIFLDSSGTDYTFTRNIYSIGASQSGTIEAGARGIFFKCTSGSATLTPNGVGTVNLSATGQNIYNFEYTPPGSSHGEISYTTSSSSSLEITEDR